jgi:hypothetical protein
MDNDVEDARDSDYQTDATAMPEYENPEEQIANIVNNVYEECWGEFYKWETKYCKTRLESLRSTQPAIHDWSSDWSETEDWDPNDITTANPNYQLDQEPIIRKSSASIKVQHGGSSELVTTIAPKVTISTVFPPVPPYEFCRYSNQSYASYINHEDEIEEEQSQGESGQAKGTEDQGNLHKNSRITDNKEKQMRKRWRLWIPFCPYTDPDSVLEESSRRGIIDGQVCEWTEPKVSNNDGR